MTRNLLLSPPDVGELEQEYVIRGHAVGLGGSGGPGPDAFEDEMAGRVGVDHAVALASGTAALHLALVSGASGPATWSRSRRSPSPRP